ncbi:hypothetical protein SmaMPs15_000074 [Stenotrophomonas maltophilia phage vB_SmaM_Ps15]|uniref:Uncharacterized protein n=1 Tax=Stenotrophomonas maltophilia phage vB_SmaM_Ps15 TaxID=3071007 RepID=A0AAE9FLK3_9CAUD|nr:hypothetical protein PQC01_gp074 [Stenotrophomonas maltophilia phage vB_SmaM_Ps15]UMO77225.1 hypothetical protein SmaMPs15_000074 [Stenotrophomonas maltophilia phage vB_SmaM_Ps15]
MRQLAVYSDPLHQAGKRLQKLFAEDDRLVGYSKEDGRVFLYLDTSGDWAFDDGAYTMSAENVNEAIRVYKQTIQKIERCPYCKDRGYTWSHSLAPYKIPCNCKE